MTSSSQIKAVLQNITKNEWLDLSYIKDYVSKHIELDSQDMEPIKDDSSYPKWCRTLHGVLSEYKKEGLVDHQERISAKNSIDKIAKEAKYFFID